VLEINTIAYENSARERTITNFWDATQPSDNKAKTKKHWLRVLFTEPTTRNYFERFRGSKLAVHLASCEYSCTPTYCYCHRDRQKARKLIQ
jgi:hypothetical protein